MARLFVVTASFAAVHIETGGQRMLKAGEKLFAEFPAPATRVVTFEQDNHEFQVGAPIFLASTALDKPAAQEKCPKCPRLVTSTYQSGNKKFYNHGEGGSIDWKDGQVFDLKLADYCTVEIETEPAAKDGK
jgi:hypothetical protein